MSYLGTNKIGKMYLGSTAIGKAYLGSNLVFQRRSSPSPSGRLPDGYTELAYVATNSSAWINTGIAGSTSLEVRIRFSVGNYVQNGSIYGNYIDESHKCNRAILASASSLYVADGNSFATSVDGFSPNMLHTLSVSSGTASLESATTSISGTTLTANTSNICLGNRSVSNTDSRDIGLRVYSFIIKDSGTTVLNYVPARRESDSSIGFYNLANSTFVKSETGTAFTAGPVAEYSGQMLKCLDWDGEDAAVSSKWYDSIGNQYFTISSGTHGTDYHQFLNSIPFSASQYATLFGALPDLGYHWKVVADVAIRTQARNPTIFCPIDFGSLGATDSGTSAFSFLVSASTGNWSCNPKFNFSGSYYPSFPLGKFNITAETITTSETWIRRTVTVGVRASSTSGKDEAYISVDGRGSATSEEFTPMRFNNWMTGKNYIGRGNINPSPNYPYATSCRIYSIQVYYETFI